MVKINFKDIAKSTEDVIAVLVNCNGTGLDDIAKRIYNEYKISNDFYYLACKNKDYKKLLGNNLILETENNYVVNMFSKCGFKNKKESVHINSLIKCLEEVKQFCLSRNFTLAIPLDIKVDYEDRNWLLIKEILEEVFFDIDLELYVRGD